MTNDYDAGYIGAFTDFVHGSWTDTTEQTSEFESGYRTGIEDVSLVVNGAMTDMHDFHVVVRYFGGWAKPTFRGSLESCNKVIASLTRKGLPARLLSLAEYNSVVEAGLR